MSFAGVTMRKLRSREARGVTSRIPQPRSALDLHFDLSTPTFLLLGGATLNRETEARRKHHYHTACRSFVITQVCVPAEMESQLDNFLRRNPRFAHLWKEPEAGD